MMEDLIAAHSELFLRSMGLGLCCGVFFEVFRLFRCAFFHQKWMVTLEDFFFWIVLSAVFPLFVFAYSSAVIRWFSLAGIFLGFSLYFLTLGRWIQKISEKMIRRFKRIFLFLWRISFLPIFIFFKKTVISLFTKYKTSAIMRKKKKDARKLQRTISKILSLAEEGFFQR